MGTITISIKVHIDDMSGRIYGAPYGFEGVIHEADMKYGVPHVRETAVHGNTKKELLTAIQKLV